MNVRIGPYDIPIKWENEEDPDYGSTRGSFDMENGIEIRQDQSPSLQASSLIHECLHAIFEVYNVPREGLGEEEVCEFLEGPLLALIRDNPKLVEDIGAVADGYGSIDITETAD